MVDTKVVDERKSDVDQSMTVSLSERVETLYNKILQLQRDVQQRRDGLEANIRLAKKQRDEEIESLRDEYDKQLNRGDKKAADAVLNKIASARNKLVTLAKQIEETSGDLSDLEARSDELYKESLKLSEAANENFRESRTVSERAGGLTGMLTYNISPDIRQVKDMFDKAKKTAEQILSE